VTAGYNTGKIDSHGGSDPSGKPLYGGGTGASNYFNGNSLVARGGDLYNAGDIDLDSIVLKKDEFEVGGEYGEFESGRVKIKFPCAAVQSVLEPGDVELTVLGELEDATPFEGTDTVRVIEPQ